MAGEISIERNRLSATTVTCKTGEDGEREKKKRATDCCCEPWLWQTKIWGGVRKENRRRKRVRSEEEGGRQRGGAEGDNNMRESLRSRGGWGIEGGSVIATQGKKESSQLCLRVCILENEQGVTCKYSQCQCCVCVCTCVARAVSQRTLHVTCAWAAQI